MLKSAQARISTSQLVRGGNIPFSMLLSERILIFKILHIAFFVRLCRARNVLMLLQNIKISSIAYSFLFTDKEIIQQFIVIADIY